MKHEKTIERAKKVFSHCDNPVMSTVDRNGFPQSRVMHTSAIDDDFTIYFITMRGTQKTDHIDANPRIALLWTGQDWETVHIKGEAYISEDRDLRERFWHEGLTAYFAGADDPNMQIIVIRPVELTCSSVGSTECDTISF